MGMIQNRYVTHTGPERPFRCLDMCAPVVLLAESNIALFVFIIKFFHIGGDTFLSGRRSIPGHSSQFFFHFNMCVLRLCFCDTREK